MKIVITTGHDVGRPSGSVATRYMILYKQLNAYQNLFVDFMGTIFVLRI